MDYYSAFMDRPSISFRAAIPLLGALVVAACTAVLLVLGPHELFSDGRASWVDVVFTGLLAGNLSLAALLWRREMTPAVAAGAVAVGLASLFASSLLHVLSQIGTVDVVLFVPSAIVAAFGVWYVEPASVRRTVLAHPRSSVAAGIAVIAIEVSFSPIETSLRLLPLLWANAVGYYVVPHVALAGIRLGRGTTAARRGSVAVATIGVALVLFTPWWNYPFTSTLALCAPGTSSSLAYSIEREPLRFLWSDGCNSKTVNVDHRYAVAGLSALLVGLAGYALASLGSFRAVD